MKVVTLKAKTKRMKQRIEQHGDRFRVNEQDGDDMLIESLKTSWGFRGMKLKWLAWVTPEDVEIVGETVVIDE